MKRQGNWMFVVLLVVGVSACSGLHAEVERAPQETSALPATEAPILKAYMQPNHAEVQPAMLSGFAAPQP